MPIREERNAYVAFVARTVIVWSSIVLLRRDVVWRRGALSCWGKLG
jgi:hypothetical protein